MVQDKMVETESRHAGGRPDKLQPKRIKILLANISKGLSIKSSCAKARISHVTLRNWIKAGEIARENGDTNSKYFKFLTQYELAMAESEEWMLDTFKAIVNTDPRPEFSVTKKRVPVYDPKTGKVVGYESVVVEENKALKPAKVNPMALLKMMDMRGIYKDDDTERKAPTVPFGWDDSAEYNPEEDC